MRKPGQVGLVGGLMAATVVATAGAGLPPSPAARQPALVTNQVLHSFGGSDGAGPLYGVTPGPGGVLYGTTVFGGTQGDGTVFTLTPNGSGGYTEQTLHSFTGQDGNAPGGNVILDSSGDLFGETIIGGADDAGEVFELTPSGSGYTEKVLYSFTGGLDGSQPVGALAQDSQGDLFGVTQFGGTGGQGVIFELTPSATGYTEQVLHSFDASGGQPQAGLTRAANGTLYGTLYGFGTTNANGAVFSLTLTSSGPVYRALYAFQGGSDGANPFAALTVDDTTGVIYGTTQFGGTAADGTAFSLTPSGTGYTESVLHSFTTAADGLEPESPLLLTAAGDLFGTTSLAGKKCSGIGCGTIFELVPNGSGGYSFQLTYQFNGPPDGANPEFGALSSGSGGLLIGTTRSGGTASGCSDGGPGGVTGCGTVYTIEP